MTKNANTLFDLGERRILKEIIPHFVAGAGDDCASITLQSPNLVITTDPVPRPAAEIIGNDNDPYWMGWLLVTINASDIAAAGARPEGFVAALDLPREYPVPQFERLLQGIADSCAKNGLRYVGGNIREASYLAAIGTAVGTSLKQPTLGRRGAREGDHLVVLGNGGRFWADAFAIREGKSVDKTTSPIFSPISQANIVYRLNEANFLTCAMDTSDGLAPTLEELAAVNALTLEVDLAAMRNATSFVTSLLRPERLWFGWGDWCVVVGVSPDALPNFTTAMQDLAAPWAAIGRFAKGPANVLLTDGLSHMRAGRLESERFASDSWFTQGIEEYIRRLEAYVLP